MSTSVRTVVVQGVCPCDISSWQALPKRRRGHSGVKQTPRSSIHRDCWRQGWKWDFVQATPGLAGP